MSEATIEVAYTALRRLRLAGTVRPETLPQIHRERWRAATTLPPRLLWQGRASWLPVRPGGATHQRASGGRLMR
jgi:hypothetical protein